MQIFEHMPKPQGRSNKSELFHEFISHGHDLRELPGCMFQGLSIYLDQEAANHINGHEVEKTGPPARSLDDPELSRPALLISFAGGRVVTQLREANKVQLTHIVAGADRSRLKILRKAAAKQTWVTTSFPCRSF